jgi:hypothetical protein
MQLSDLMAMKLKVVGDRGELRDYFDLMTIEQRAGRTADEGLALFIARFQPQYPQQAINHILLGLGYFDDVDPDDALPVPRSQIVDYWTRRQPEIVAARGRLYVPGPARPGVLRRGAGMRMSVMAGLIKKARDAGSCAARSPGTERRTRLPPGRSRTSACAARW